MKKVGVGFVHFPNPIKQCAQILNSNYCYPHYVVKIIKQFQFNIKEKNNFYTIKKKKEVITV